MLTISGICSCSQFLEYALVAECFPLLASLLALFFACIYHSSLLQSLQLSLLHISDNILLDSCAHKNPLIC